MPLELILRLYQGVSVEAIRAHFRRGVRRVLLFSPTGSGKTVIFAFICKATAERGKRAMILVHGQELADQTSVTLTGMGVPHGIIAAGYGMRRPMRPCRWRASQRSPDASPPAWNRRT